MNLTIKYFTERKRILTSLPKYERLCPVPGEDLVLKQTQWGLYNSTPHWDIISDDEVRENYDQCGHGEITNNADMVCYWLVANKIPVTKENFCSALENAECEYI